MGKSTEEEYVVGGRGDCLCNHLILCQALQLWLPPPCRHSYGPSALGSARCTSGRPHGAAASISSPSRPKHCLFHVADTKLQLRLQRAQGPAQDALLAQRQDTRTRDP